MLLARVGRLESQVSDLIDEAGIQQPGAGGDAETVSPFQKIYLNGTEGTITGSYSTATPFLWWDQSNNTAEWKSSDLSPSPLDTKIRDGSKTGDSEWRDWR